MHHHLKSIIISNTILIFVILTLIGLYIAYYYRTIHLEKNEGNKLYKYLIKIKEENTCNDLCCIDKLKIKDEIKSILIKINNAVGIGFELLDASKKVIINGLEHSPIADYRDKLLSNVVSLNGKTLEFILNDDFNDIIELYGPNGLNLTKKPTLIGGNIKENMDAIKKSF